MRKVICIISVLLVCGFMGAAPPVFTPTIQLPQQIIVSPTSYNPATPVRLAASNPNIQFFDIPTYNLQPALGPKWTPPDTPLLDPTMPPATMLAQATPPPPVAEKRPVQAEPEATPDPAAKPATDAKPAATAGDKKAWPWTPKDPAAPDNLNTLNKTKLKYSFLNNWKKHEKMERFRQSDHRDNPNLPRR